MATMVIKPGLHAVKKSDVDVTPIEFKRVWRQWTKVNPVDTGWHYVGNNPPPSDFIKSIEVISYDGTHQLYEVRVKFEGDNSARYLVEWNDGVF